METPEIQKVIKKTSDINYFKNYYQMHKNDFKKIAEKNKKIYYECPYCGCKVGIKSKIQHTRTVKCIKNKANKTKEVI
jgi:DNA-directed RNA polymerase subunit RPC12/RpoP